jgi:hypothetical protein
MNRRGHGSRIFGVEDARALLPTLVQGFTRTTHITTRYRAIARNLTAQGLMEPGGKLPAVRQVRTRPALAAQVSLARALRQMLATEIEALEAHGVVVRDVHAGQVDFRTVVEGQREAFLCWRLGEATVAHFHEIDASCTERSDAAGTRFFVHRQLVPPER